MSMQINIIFTKHFLNANQYNFYQAFSNCNPNKSPTSHQRTPLKKRKGEKKAKGIKNTSPNIPNKKNKGNVTNWRTAGITKINPTKESNMPNMVKAQSKSAYGIENKRTLHVYIGSTDSNNYEPAINRKTNVQFIYLRPLITI